mmetsp:Transcript_16114/g.34056  ORF Transcript_16114/g.34056 Transcript_16114/m.34056 type:complete len:359 (+) Transcript_16114:71-1147(+)
MLFLQGLTSKRTMPTRVDTAAKSAHEEISNAVKQIENNLTSSSPSNSGMSSPLFRDEVQQHEMRYLDRLLLGQKSSATGNLLRQSREVVVGGAACGNPNKKQPSSNRSKIASILSPNNRKDNYTTKHGDSQRIHNKQQFKNTVTRHTPNKSSNTSDIIGHNLHNKMSTLIHRQNQPKKSNSCGHHPKRSIRTTAVPSRSKRRQTNQKLIHRAQLSSRRVISKMVRLGRRCTRNLTTVKKIIHHGVVMAVARAHSMLEQTSHFNDGMSSTKKGQGGSSVNENSRNAKTAVVSLGLPNSDPKERDTVKSASLKDPASVRVPPKDAFAFAPSWMLGGTKHMSSKAVSMAKRTIHNERAMKR